MVEVSSGSEVPQELEMISPTKAKGMTKLEKAAYLFYGAIAFAAISVSAYGASKMYTTMKHPDYGKYRYDAGTERFVSKIDDYSGTMEFTLGLFALAGESMLLAEFKKEKESASE